MGAYVSSFICLKAGFCFLNTYLTMYSLQFGLISSRKKKTITIGLKTKIGMDNVAGLHRIDPVEHSTPITTIRKKKSINRMEWEPKPLDMLFGCFVFPCNGCLSSFFSFFSTCNRVIACQKIQRSQC